jgi:nitrilase
MCHRKRTVDIESVKKYIASSLKIDSPQMRLICATAKENKIAVMLGFSENENQSLYISQALIGADGEIKMTRRKIKPTHMERTIYGDGSGASLNNVVDLPGIGKVGGLCCWEHTQPLLRYHTYTQGEEFHVAAWPPMLPLAQTPDALWSQAAEGIECSTSRSKNSVRAKFSNFLGAKILTSTHCIEGGTFSLYCNSVVSKRNVEIQDLEDSIMWSVPGGGLSAIYGPDGRQISESTLGPDEEGLVIADCNMEEITRNKHFLDTCGHYSRPDLIWLGVDTREKKQVRPE